MLIEYLSSLGDDELRGLSVLELGAGCGAVGARSQGNGGGVRVHERRGRLDSQPPRRQFVISRCSFSFGFDSMPKFMYEEWNPRKNGIPAQRCIILHDLGREHVSTYETSAMPSDRLALARGMYLSRRGCSPVVLTDVQKAATRLSSQEPLKSCTPDSNPTLFCEGQAC